MALHCQGFIARLGAVVVAAAVAVVVVWCRVVRGISYFFSAKFTENFIPAITHSLSRG